MNRNTLTTLRVIREEAALATLKRRIDFDNALRPLADWDYPRHFLVMTRTDEGGFAGWEGLLVDVSVRGILLRDPKHPKADPRFISAESIETVRETGNPNVVYRSSEWDL